MPTVDDAWVPRHVTGVVAVPVQHESVLLDQATGVMHALDAVGTLMWQCFDGVATIGEIAVDVADVFAVPAEQASQDLAGFVETLRSIGMVSLDVPDGRTPTGAGPAQPEVADGLLRNPPDP